MTQSSCAAGTVTPDVDIGAGAHGRDFEGSFGLQDFSLHAGRGLCQYFSPPQPKNFCMSAVQMVPCTTAASGRGWRVTSCISGSYPQRLPGDTGLVSDRSIPCGGSRVQRCCPSHQGQTTPQAEPGPSALAVATGCHPAPGWRQAPLWPGLA